MIEVSRGRDGDTHHGTFRNLRFEDVNWVAGGGAIVGIAASTSHNADVHDIVFYNNTFKNCGVGYDWGTNDNDHHGVKVDGWLGFSGSTTRRIWIIENRPLGGDSPDPIDGRIKSLSGNLVQVGDQITASGGAHHVYVAGNYQEYGRQALGWTKRSRDVIFSSNVCTDTYALAGGNGQCYGHQYVAFSNWWISNVATESAAAWMHTGGDDMEGPLYVIGNIFYGNKDEESDDNWRRCSGVTLFTGFGIHYFVNNAFDDQCHGIWAGNFAFDADSEMHVYNNIFARISSPVDSTSRALTISGANG